MCTYLYQVKSPGRKPNAEKARIKQLEMRVKNEKRRVGKHRRSAYRKLSIIDSASESEDATDNFEDNIYSGKRKAAGNDTQPQKRVKLLLRSSLNSKTLPKLQYSGKESPPSSPERSESEINLSPKMVNEITNTHCSSDNRNYNIDGLSQGCGFGDQFYKEDHMPVSRNYIAHVLANSKNMSTFHTENFKSFHSPRPLNFHTCSDTTGNSTFGYSISNSPEYDIWQNMNDLEKSATSILAGIKYDF